MRVFVTTTAVNTPQFPWATKNYVRLLEAAGMSKSGRHTLANHPDDADVVLFVETPYRFQNDILASSMYKKYRDKSMVFDSSDNSFPIIPGLYVGLSNSQAQDPWYQSGFYLRVGQNRSIEEFHKLDIKPDLLFSFVGKVTNHIPTRTKIKGLHHDRSLLVDSSSKQADNDADFIKTIFRSKFVLAPRGLGPATWRLFETMCAGRVPVIISDDWVAPKGVNWESFAIRIPESDIALIPDVLESMEHRSEEMGSMARREWSRCFAMHNSFFWISERLLEIQRTMNEMQQKQKISISRIVKEGELLSFARETLRVYKNR